MNVFSDAVNSYYLLNFCNHGLLNVYLHRYLYVLVPQVCYIHLGFYDLLSLDLSN